MGTISVCFLGKDYLLPDQLPKYVSILERFEDYTNQLLQKVVDQAKKGDYSGGGDKDFAFWSVPVEDIAKDIIKNASNDGVYDLTTSELVEQNPGYHQLRKACHDTMQGMVKALMNAMDEWQAGYNSAHSQAASNITGSGVSIWTNSASTALLYAAFESSTLKKQCNQADREFQAAIVNLNAQNNDKLEREQLRVKTQVYYPGCNAAIVNLTSHMLSIYLERITRSGAFDYRAVKQYNMSASLEILKNLDLVNQKQEVLHRAFEKCPYNPDVYKELLDLGMVDFNTFAIAKYLCQGQILLECVAQYCEKNVGSSVDISEAVRIWADYEDVEERDVYYTLYESTLDSACNGFNSVVHAINDENQCKQWIVKHITGSATRLIQTQETLDSAISSVLNGIIDEKTYCLMLNMDLLDIAPYNLTGEKTTNYSKIMGALKSGLLSRIDKIIETLISVRKGVSAEIDSLNHEISLKTRQLEDQKKEYDDELTRIRQDRQKCGFFAFSLKKELDARIAEAERNKQVQVAEAEKEIKRLRTECQKKESQMDSIE